MLLHPPHLQTIHNPTEEEELNVWQHSNKNNVCTCTDFGQFAAVLAMTECVTWLKIVAGCW